MKTLQFLLGLAILVFVLWTAIAPVNANSKMLIGGVGDGCACGGDLTRTCTAQQGQTCSANITLCDSGTGGTCRDTHGMGAFPCHFSDGCKDERSQTCN